MANEKRLDLISRQALLDEYDRVHIGPPGGARKLIANAPTAVQRWMEGMRMTKIKHYCDHCGKELDGMKDYLACEIDVWCGAFEVDLCADCINQLGRIVKDFCSYGEGKDNGTTKN